MTHRDEFIDKSKAFLHEVRDMTPGVEMEKWLNTKYSPDSDFYEDMARLITLGIEEGWAANQEVEGRIIDAVASTIPRLKRITSA